MDVSFANTVEELIAQAKQMMQQSTDIMAELRGRSVEGSAEHGKVTAVADVMGPLREIHVHPTALRSLSNLSLGDAIVTAVRAAEDAATKARDEAFNQMTFNGKPIRQILEDGPDVASFLPPGTPR